MRLNIHGFAGRGQKITEAGKKMTFRGQKNDFADDFADAGKIMPTKTTNNQAVFCAGKILPTHLVNL